MDGIGWNWMGLNAIGRDWMGFDGIGWDLDKMGWDWIIGWVEVVQFYSGMDGWISGWVEV